jgi:hypothetical protein
VLPARKHIYKNVSESHGVYKQVALSLSRSLALWTTVSDVLAGEIEKKMKSFAGEESEQASERGLFLSAINYITVAHCSKTRNSIKLEMQNLCTCKHTHTREMTTTTTMMMLFAFLRDFVAAAAAFRASKNLM